MVNKCCVPGYQPNYKKMDVEYNIFNIPYIICVPRFPKNENLRNDIYVEWKTKSTITEMYNNKKINFKTGEK